MTGIFRLSTLPRFEICCHFGHFRAFWGRFRSHGVSRSLTKWRVLAVGLLVMATKKKAKVARGVKTGRNIYHLTDRLRAKPYLWKQTIDGHKYREYFIDLEAAQAAQKAKLSSVAKYSSLAHEFDKDAYAEWRNAKNLLPVGVELGHVVADWVARNGSIISTDTTTAAAYTLFIESKTAARAKLKKRPLSPEHLSDLRWHPALMLSRFGHLPPARITGRQLLELYAEPDQAARSILNKHTTLKNFFGWCVSESLLGKSPYAEIGANKLPDAGKSVKHPLPLDSIVRMLGFFETQYPQYSLWLALRLFLGLRTKEGQRFRPEWIDLERKMVRVPGWEKGKPGTKTRDDWALYDIPANFWAWVKAYPVPAGREFVAFPYVQIWRRIRDGLIGEGILREFESNAFRDSFCTYSFSANPDPRKVAAMLKHRDPATMYESYLGCLRPAWEGRAFSGIFPGSASLEK